MADLPVVSLTEKVTPANGDDLLLEDNTANVTKKIGWDNVKAAILAQVAPVTTIGTIDSETEHANGAVITGNTLYMQNATNAVPGLMSTGIQNLYGRKRFDNQSVDADPSYRNTVEGTMSVANTVDHSDDFVAGVWGHTEASGTFNCGQIHGTLGFTGSGTGSGAISSMTGLYGWSQSASSFTGQVGYIVGVEGYARKLDSTYLGTGVYGVSSGIQTEVAGTNVGVLFEGSGSADSGGTFDQMFGVRITNLDATSMIGFYCVVPSSHNHMMDLHLHTQSLLKFQDSDNSNWVAFKAPATIASDITWTLPNADGTTGQVLSTNGSGVLSWSAGGGGSAYWQDGVATYASLPTGVTVGEVRSTLDDELLWQWNGASWDLICNGPLNIGTFDSESPSANGLVNSFSTLYAQSADETYPGMVNNTVQTFSGAKRTSNLVADPGTTTQDYLGSYLEVNNTVNNSSNHTENAIAAKITKTDTTNETGGGYLTGLFSSIDYSSSGTSNVNHQLFGGYISNNSSGSPSYTTGAALSISNFGIGVISEAYGYRFISTQAGVGTTTTVKGFSSEIDRSSGTLTNAYGYYSNLSGTIGTAYSYFANSDHLSSFYDVELKAESEIRFKEAIANGSNYVGFKAPATLGGNVIWTLPTVEAFNAGNILSSDAAGNLSFNGNKKIDNVFVDGTTNQNLLNIDAYVSNTINIATSHSVWAVNASTRKTDNFNNSGIGLFGGVLGSVSHTGTGTMSNTNMYGVIGASATTGVSGLTYQYGVVASVANGPGTTTTATGVYSAITQNASGTITNAYCFNADSTNLGTAITNSYGYYVNDIQGTNRWAFYSSDTSLPSLFGNVKILDNVISSNSGDLELQGLASGDAVSITGNSPFVHDIVKAGVGAEGITPLGAGGSNYDITLSGDMNGTNYIGRQTYISTDFADAGFDIDSGNLFGQVGTLYGAIAGGSGTVDMLRVLVTTTENIDAGGTLTAAAGISLLGSSANNGTIGTFTGVEILLDIDDATGGVLTNAIGFSTTQLLDPPVNYTHILLGNGSVAPTTDFYFLNNLDANALSYLAGAATIENNLVVKKDIADSLISIPSVTAIKEFTNTADVTSQIGFTTKFISTINEDGFDHTTCTYYAAGSLINSLTDIITSMDVIGYNSKIVNGGAGTITNAIMYNGSCEITGAGDITDSYVMKIDTIDGVNKHGIYINEAGADNYFAGAMQIDGNLGFYGTTPIAQQASSGAATAGAVYTSAEQTMIQEMYDALRAYGLLT